MQLSFKSAYLATGLNPLFAGWADSHGTLERKLYAQHKATGESFASLKTRFCAEHVLQSREYNALAINLQGKLDSISELQKETLLRLSEKITQLKKQLKKVKASIAKAGKPRIAKLKYQKLLTRKYRLEQQIHTREAKLLRLKTQYSEEIPRICFGTKKQFRGQHHLTEQVPQTALYLKYHAYGGELHAEELQELETSLHSAWKARWQASRNNQFYILGSKDETAGNQRCQIKHLGGHAFSLKVRVPPRLGAGMDYITVPFTLPYGSEHLLANMARGVSLSYRFIRVSEEHWQVIVSTEVSPVEFVTCSGIGAIGIDFNENHLAVTETDRFGNLVQSFSLPFNLYGKTGDQRGQILSEVLDKVLTLAIKAGKPIGMEKLDFRRKKKAMQALSAKGRVQLSSFCYSQYQALLKSKCARQGVHLVQVAPAYTSIQGKVKHAIPKGLTVHQSAAYVIARKTQSFSERLPGGDSVRIPLFGAVGTLKLPARMAGESVNVSWQVLGKAIASFEKSSLQARKASPAVPRNSTVELQELPEERHPVTPLCAT